MENLKSSSITTSDDISCSTVHTSENIGYAGLMSGVVESYRISGENCELISTFSGTKNCRSLSSTETCLLSCRCEDLLVYDVNTEKVKWKKENSHSEFVYSSVARNEHVFFCGYEDGIIKMWDVRKENCCKRFDEQCDFISSMMLAEGSDMLFSGSGDGTLGVYDLKTGKHQFSEFLDDEVLSLAMIKQNRKLLCGTGEGNILAFTDGQWGLPTDTFCGNMESIQSMNRIDDDTVVIGTGNGTVALFQLHPSKIIGVFHNFSMPVFSMDMTREGSLLISTFSSEFTCMDISFLMKDSLEFDDDESSEKEGGDVNSSGSEIATVKRKPDAFTSKGRKKGRKKPKTDFFDDL